MRLAIGIVISNNFPAPTAFWESYEALILGIAEGRVNQALPPDLQITGLRRIKSGKFPIDVARNEICRSVLDEGTEDALLFLDCDMTFPTTLIERLIGARKDIITARYHYKKPPFLPVLLVQPTERMKGHEDGQFKSVHFGRGIFEIDRCGAGALLIQRKVLTRMRSQYGDNWFRYGKDRKTGEFTVSEDMAFCEQAQALGYSIFADWDLECRHGITAWVDRGWNLPLIMNELNGYARMSADDQQRVKDNIVVCGYEDGVEIAPGVVIGEYQRPRKVEV